MHTFNTPRLDVTQLATSTVAQCLYATFLILLLAAGTPARAAGTGALNCAQPRNAQERTICADRNLTQLDAEANGLWFAYSRVPFLMGMSGMRQDEQREFQEKRTGCKTHVACLRRVYQVRIDGLKVSIAQAMDNVRQEENVGPPSFPTTLPMPVEDIVSGYAYQCRTLGGTMTGPSRPDMLAADLDGDSKADYVPNPQNLKCSAAATAFCGNGGCQISIALSSDGYKHPVAVLGGQPTLTQTADGTRFEVWVDRTNCTGATLDQACWAIFSWKDGKLQRQYHAHARAQ